MVFVGLGQLIKKDRLKDDYRDIVDVIGIESFCALVDTFGGSSLWIPKARSIITASEIEDEVKIRSSRGESVEKIARDLEITYAEARKYSK